MPIRTRCLSTIGFATALLVVSAASTEAALVFRDAEIRPAHPTTSDDVVLAVTADVNAELCGKALTLAWFSPESPEISLLAVPVLEDVSCPASEEFFTFEFPLGKLAAGTHTVGVLAPGPVFSPFLTFTVSADPADHALLHGRFEARIAWQDFSGASGIGRVVPNPTGDSALFWFFDSDNWEILVKVLDGCALNGHYWILGSGATTVRFSLEVLDTQTGRIWRHDNPLDHPAGTFTDTSFAACH